MQTLSTCCLLKLPRLELGFNCSCVRNKGDIPAAVTCNSVLCFTRSSNSKRLLNFSLRVGGHSDIQLVVLSRDRKVDCDAAVDDENSENCNSANRVLEETQGNLSQVDCDAVVDDELSENCSSTSRILEETQGFMSQDDCKAVVDDEYSQNCSSTSRILEESGGNLSKSASISSENVNTDDGVKGKRVMECSEKTKRVDVRGLAKKMENAVSVDDVDSVLKDEGKLPLQVFSAIIRSFGREMKLQPAFAVVDWLKKKNREDECFDGPNLFIYNSLLGAVKQCGNFEKVEAIMNEIKSAEFFPNVITYNTLMGIYLDQGRAAEALELFEGLRRKGLSPSPSSYSTALLAYRKMEDGIGALKFFADMREKYMKQELQNNGDGEDWESEFLKIEDFTRRICYQVMRRWLVKDKNLSTSVLKLLIEMDKAGMPPARTEYERLIWACTREEHYSVSKELYNRIRDRHSDVSLSVCNHIIWLMGRAKRWWAALEIFEDLLEKGPKPNSLSYELIVAHFNVLLNAAQKRGNWRWGLRLLEKMEAKGLKPGSREWNAVLIACSKASETTAAVELFKKMVEKGEKPTEVSYGALLSALEKGKMYDEAIRVWEHMLKVGVKPNLYSFTIMASVYVGLGKVQLLDDIIKEMVSTGNDPTVVTFNAIISICARNGSGGTAYEWFERMKAMSIEPNEITYDMLIEALTKDGKPRLAYDLYLRAVNDGLSPPARAYDAVIQSSQTFGATINIDSLGPRPSSEHKKDVLT